MLEEPPELATRVLASFSDEEEAGSGPSEEGGRGARKRGSGEGGGGGAVCLGMRGMGKSLMAV